MQTFTRYVFATDDEDAGARERGIYAASTQITDWVLDDRWVCER
jgi:hypothetical protein